MPSGIPGRNNKDRRPGCQRQGQPEDGNALPGIILAGTHHPALLAYQHQEKDHQRGNDQITIRSQFAKRRDGRLGQPLARLPGHPGNDEEQEHTPVGKIGGYIRTPTLPEGHFCVGWVEQEPMGERLIEQERAAPVNTTTAPPVNKRRLPQSGDCERKARNIRITPDRIGQHHCTQDQVRIKIPGIGGFERSDDQTAKKKAAGQYQGDSSIWPWRAARRAPRRSPAPLS